MEHIYDMIVIGGGPGGYTAALYAARAGLEVLVLEKMAAGGQMTQTTQIDNYPGFDQGIDGFQLGEQMRAGAERFGAKSKFAEVSAVDLAGEVKSIETPQERFLARTVVIATGADHKHLGLPQEVALAGRGVSYCATCDGMFYRGKTVAVIGGGNSAAADALTLARICKKVILVHRRDTLRASKVYYDQLKALENVEFRWNSVPTAFLGEERLSGLGLQDVGTGEETEISVDGVFVSIGRQPATALFQGQLAMDSQGYLLADETTQTSVPGVYAVGDVRTKEVRQIITAAADGAVAVHFAESYLSQGKL